MACRNAERGEEAANEINGESTEPKAIFLATMDLGSLRSIRDFCTSFTRMYDRLDALVNNAGIMACPYGRTEDGFETQIGCNHLGHFLLQQLLAPLLLKTAETTGQPSRLVCLSSVAAAESTLSKAMPDIDLDDLNWEKREYDEGLADGSSKLANYLHALEAPKRYPPEKILCFSVHPGWVESNLDVHAVRKMLGEGYMANMIASFVRTLFKLKGDMIQPVDGAQTTLHCILEDASKMENGRFYSQFGIYKNPDYADGGWPLKEPFPNPNATPEKAKALWDLSKTLVNL